MKFISSKYIIEKDCPRCKMVNKWAAISIHGFFLRGENIENDMYKCYNCGFQVSGTMINNEANELYKQ